jgi:hypothetical protein
MPHEKQDTAENASHDLMKDDPACSEGTLRAKDFFEELHGDELKRAEKGVWVSLERIAV